jgi:hypothetical protein
MIYDFYGRLFYQVELNTSFNQLQLIANKLESGIYVGNLLIDGVLVKSEKLVKSDIVLK